MKEIKKINNNVKTMSFSDLYSMYNFVNGMNIHNLNPAMKSIVKNKSIELENEIFVRIFSFNPHDNKQTAELHGKDPIQVLQSIEKTFIVASPDKSENK